jgi:hypothetical protein
MDLQVIPPVYQAVFQHYLPASYHLAPHIILARLPVHLRGIYKVPQVGQQMLFHPLML